MVEVAKEVIHKLRKIQFFWIRPKAMASILLPMTIQRKDSSEDMVVMLPTVPCSGEVAQEAWRLVPPGTQQDTAWARGRLLLACRSS